MPLVWVGTREQSPAQSLGRGTHNKLCVHSPLSLCRYAPLPDEEELTREGDLGKRESDALPPLSQTPCHSALACLGLPHAAHPLSRSDQFVQTRRSRCPSPGPALGTGQRSPSTARTPPRRSSIPGDWESQLADHHTATAHLSSSRQPQSERRRAQWQRV